MSGGDGDDSGRREIDVHQVLRQARRGTQFVDLTTPITDVDGACAKYEDTVGPLPMSFRRAMWRIADTVGERRCTLGNVAVSYAVWEFSGVDDLRETMLELLEWAQDFADDVPHVTLGRDEPVLSRARCKRLEARRRELDELRLRIRHLADLVGPRDDVSQRTSVTQRPKGPEENTMDTPGKPKYEVGQRVRRTDEEGRVQQVSYAEGVFKYVVKWDNGPTTSHVESELAPATLPPHYP